MIITERTAAWASLIPGLLLAGALAPNDLPNFLFFAGSQLAVLATVAASVPRPAVLAGVALVLPLYLVSFAAWLFGRVPPDSMAWLGYIIALPGAAVAAIGLGLWLRSRRMPATVAMLAAAAAAGGGLALAQLGVCSTVMHCLG